MIEQLNDRSREIFRLIAENYVKTGIPVGSRTLSRQGGLNLSPASIRNVMADLEELGLIYAPHTSAGRLPTERGLRLFVDGLMEIGNLTHEERQSIEAHCSANGRSLEEVLGEATGLLSGLSHCAGLVIAPKSNAPLKHVEFVHLSSSRALVILITEDGLVENRIIEVPLGMPQSSLVEASNYLNARLKGRTIEEARAEILTELEGDRSDLDRRASGVVEAGLATWAGDGDDRMLIVRGQANLIDEASIVGDLEHIRSMLETLETKKELARLLELADRAAGVQIFIGAENRLFGMAGCSVIVAPFSNSREQIVGAIGVIGPTRLNYAHVIPLVDYTASMVGRLMG